MKRGFLRFVLVIAGSSLAVAQSGSNGSYGGYVGSSAWSESMRHSAENQAVMRQLGGASAKQSAGGGAEQPVPADSIELAGRFVFPQGNPFPNGRLPDLRINCNAPCSDHVERAPHIFQSGDDANFSTVLKKGHSYTFSWMYYMGGKEAFTTYVVPSGGSRQVKASFAIDAKGHGQAAGNRITPRSQAAPASWAPASGGQGFTGNPRVFDLSGFPPRPTNFEEQRIVAAIQAAQDPRHSANPWVFQEQGHRMLGNWYINRGEQQRGMNEQVKGLYWKNGGQ
jgi:hypothetical protein